MSAVFTRGGQPVPLLFFAVVLTSCPGHVTTDSACSWDQEGLSHWSSAGAWQDGVVPTENASVVITSGKHVLLDTQPAPMATLIIQVNASLTWGNVPNLELRAEYILVDGAFHIGSDSCRFELPASIKLSGHASSNFQIFSEHSLIGKVLMVRENGTLEIHGKKKTSWTHLAQTIPSINDLACTFIYNHSDIKTNPFSEDRGKGLHVIVWNEDGTVFDYNVFDHYTDLKDFISPVPNGTVIGMFAYARLGLQSRTKNHDFATLDDVIINDLGGSLISKVTKTDSYSLLTTKGDKSSTVEYYKRKGRIDVDIKEDYIQLPNWETKMAFQVATSARTHDNYFRVVPVDVAYPILELADNITGWLPGDKIVVASTDFDWEQAEVREIIDCRGLCSQSQIRVNASFRYRHFGNFTYNVDERAEVGLLTRNIVIEGAMEDRCYYRNWTERKVCKRFGQDTYGGHIKIMRGHKSVHVQGVELYHMGQQIKSGAYPLHFHMCDEAPGSWVKYNSIHHSFSRCVTIHGTHQVEVSHNVCYDHVGHGYFIENSVEQNNTLYGNLGLGTRFGTLIMSDYRRDWCKQDFRKKDYTESCGHVTTFWLTHPNNNVSNNAAAGGDANGFMYVFAAVPLGESYARQLELGNNITERAAQSFPLKFYKNAVHSYKRSGIFIDSRISTGKLKSLEKRTPENGVIQDENLYEPRDPAGDPNGRRVWTKMERVTSYKNKQNNMWVKGGNINVTFASMADPESQSFSGGTTGFWTGTSVEYSVVIGRSDNQGEPTLYREQAPSGKWLTHQFERNVGGSPWRTLTGIAIYQGPMFVKHTYFDRFNTIYWNDSWTEELGKRPVSNAGAISFKKDSTYPIYTSQYTTNLTFGYCDNVNNAHWLFFGDPAKVWDWEENDGTRSAHNWDRDGSLTGTPNTYIVRNRPFFTGPECLYRPDWDMSVCPYRFVKVEFKGYGGSLSNDKKTKWPLIAYRDDAPHDPYYQQGQQRREYLLRTYTSYLIDLNTTMKGAAFPLAFKVKGWGVERQDIVRIGICMPRDTTEFYIRSNYPVVIRNTNFTRVYSMAELDNGTNKDAVYHDRTNGILFVKVWSRHDRTNDSQKCSAGKCFSLKIRPMNGNRSAIRSCFGARYPRFQDPRPPRPKPELKPCSGTGSPEGLGAIRWNEVKKILHTDFSVPCAALPRQKSPPPPSLYQGCYVESTQAFELTQKLKKSMTIDWCISRCYQRNYTYAALSKGSYCGCGHTVNTTEEAQDLKRIPCSRGCSGNRDQTCGNNKRLSIWATGM